MNASRRYLPLSLMLLLATSVSSANAGSFLDPYSHIKAPAGTAPKKKFLQQQKEPAIVPQADEVATPTTYVTMPMGHLADENAAEKKPSGLLGRTIAPFKAASNSVAKSGKFLANGAKASGEMAKKSGTLIGGGFKSDDKTKNSDHTKIAVKPKAEKKEDSKTKNHSASRVASVDDWYTREAQKTVAHKDDGSRARDLVKDPAKHTGQQTAFLERKSSKKLAISSKLNPFNKFKKAGNNDKSATEIRPTSGFADGASNPDPEVLAELEREKAAKLAAKELKEGGGNENFTPIVNEPVKKNEQLASKTKNSAKPETKSKKSKFGLNVNIAKFKPGMPSFGKGKKEKANTAIAAAPKKGVAEQDKSELDKLTAVEPVAKIDPAGEDLAPEATQPMAFTTGDKAIDAATPKGAVAEKKNKSETAIAKTPGKKGKLGGIGIANFSKFNFMNKKKQPQTATKADAPKQL